MLPERAIEELRKLRDQAGTPEVRRDGPDHDAWKAKVDAVMKSALGNDSETLREFRDVRYHIGIYSGAPGEAEEDARYFASKVDRAAALIDAAIYQLELQAEPEGQRAVANRAVMTGPIFVVHGHDDAHKYELMRLLDRTAIESDSIVLHEQASGGATILEKLERHAQTASCAVVLLRGTADEALDGHAMFSRLKVAAAIAIISNDPDKVTDEDWALAGQVMQVSDRTRQIVIDEARAARREINQSRGRDEADRASMVAGRLEADKVKRTADKITKRVKKLADRGQDYFATRELRDAVGRDREHFEDALVAVVESRILVKSGRGYRLP